jgi:histidine kinase
MSTLPLHNICELEPATDVVCDGGYKSLIKSEDFFQLLQVYIEEFERGSKIERPMVALRILEYWRQEKNGRFVKYDDQRDLWHDIGDKKAREYISKALKQITRNNSFASDGGGEGLSREVTTSCISEHTSSTETSSLSTATRATSLMSPLPNPFADGGQLIRRVSASVQENTIKKQHLYGRSQEEEDLFALYEHSISADAGCSDFLVLSGGSGVGKTALAKSLQPLVLENNGFFVEAKFEQLTLDDSLAAYISIFNDFCQTILHMHSKDLQKSHVEKITRLMGHFDDSVAVSVVPALGEILKLGSNRSSCSSTMQHEDSSSIDEEVDGSGEMVQKQEVSVLVSYSSARLKFCFSKILRSIVSQQHPLVVVLDDIQYASSVVAFGDFLTDMISHREGLFFIATNRTGLCPKALCFDQFTSLLSRDVVKIHQWNVSGLTPEAVHELIADTLSLDAAKLETLSSDFFYLTGGNALFLLELLRAFQEDDILRYDESTDQWKCDDHLLTHHPLLQVHSLSELYCVRILDLPKLAQDTLKVASVLGPCFTEEIVAKVSKSKESAYHLQLAIEAGLLNRKEEGPLAFRHDSIHTATYNLIPDEEKSAFTLQLGKRLWRKVGEKDINKYSFDIVRLLFRAQVELFQKSSSADLAAVTLLCLEASKIAAKSAGFHACIFYVEFGIRILEESDKWRDHYDLCLALHNNAVDVYYGVGQFDKVDKFVDEILANARSFEHTVQARMMRVYTLGTKKKLIDALDYGVETLSLLGDPIPSNPTKLQAVLAVSQTKRRLSKKSDAALLRIPTLTDEKKLAVMMTLQILFLNAYYARPTLAVLISCRIIDITLKHGACAVSSVGFGGYGVVISRYV